MNERLRIGETWEIRGVVNDENGVPISVSGVTVQLVSLRLLKGGQVVLDLSTPEDGTLTGDRYVFQVTPQQQVAANATHGGYTYSVRATLSDGRFTIQNDGTVPVVTSAWSNPVT
jgi:hypothetical protein